MRSLLVEGKKRIERLAGVLFLIGLAAVAVSAHAQVAPSATKSQFTLSAGGLGSVFQPDYAGNGKPEASDNPLYGIGAFVDVKFTRWVQLEAEGRWLRFNEYDQIHEDTYLAGERLPLHHFQFLHATPYAKVLAGFGQITFEDAFYHGRFTDIAYGGGSDFKLTKRFSARADFEYQQWPNHFVGTLYPYGASVGISYRILGGRDSRF